jgi:hypothetical protein
MCFGFISQLAPKMIEKLNAEGQRKGRGSAGRPIFRPAAWILRRKKSVRNQSTHNLPLQLRARTVSQRVSTELAI